MNVIPWGCCGSLSLLFSLPPSFAPSHSASHPPIRFSVLLLPLPLGGSTALALIWLFFFFLLGCADSVSWDDRTGKTSKHTHCVCLCVAAVLQRSSSLALCLLVFVLEAALGEIRKRQLKGDSGHWFQSLWYADSGTRYLEYKKLPCSGDKQFLDKYRTVFSMCFIFVES